MSASSSELSRRGALALGVGAAAAPALARAALSPDDEAAWANVRRQFAMPGAIHLEHGNFGQVARPVADAYGRALARQHRDTAIHARLAAGPLLAAARARAADALGCQPSELAFTRNATEAMQALIGGYHRLGPGDAVLLADLDYPSMQTAMGWLAERRGVRVAALALPEAGQGSSLDAYARALADDPAIRLLLLTHVSHRTGLVQPVAEIVAMARAAGVDVLVDAAHGWGQVPLDLLGWGADFVGLNAHKWIGNPLGVGLLFIRQSRLDAIAPFMGNADRGTASRIQPGTMNLAAIETLPHALDVHALMSPDARLARLSFLRERWMAPLDGHPALAPVRYHAPGALAGIGAVRLRRAPSLAAHEALARRLWHEERIMTVARDGPAAGPVLRITPAPHTPAAHVDRLAAALGRIAA